jgi:hypothetical protein
LYEFVIAEINGCHLRGMVHELIGEMGIIAYHIDLVTIGSVYHIINSDILVK